MKDLETSAKIFVIVDDTKDFTNQPYEAAAQQVKETLDDSVTSQNVEQHHATVEEENGAAAFEGL